jgi:hypothetical protein
MIRPFTCLCLLAAFGSGMYLYTEKHRAELLDRQITRVIHETEAARQRTGLLRADWALLNDPTRLQDMADKYLALKPMAPSQFVQLADLSTRLPAPVAPSAAGSTDDDSADAPVATADAPAAPGAVAPADVPAPAADVASAEPPAPPAPPPPPVKPAKPAAKPAQKLLAHNTPPHQPKHQVVVADRSPMPGSQMAPSAPLPLASPQPLGARVVSAMARPSRYSARATVVSAVPTQLGAVPYVGSALGGRTSLPPPVPLGNQ